MIHTALDEAAAKYKSLLLRRSASSEDARIRSTQMHNDQRNVSIDGKSSKPVKIALTMHPSVPSFQVDLGSPRLTDSQESLLDDEEKLRAMLEESGSPSGRKSVTFSEVIDDSPRPFLRSSSALKLRGYKGILKKEDKQRESVRRILEYASDRLYKDLCMLIEERDRTISAIEMTSADVSGLSPHSAEAQLHYRDQLLQNKGTLDARIDVVWRKLNNAPIDFAKCAWIFSVPESSLLTMRIKRKILPRRCSAFFTLERKKKSDIELASEYAQKLARIRAELVRRDSEEHIDDGYLSLLQRVSRTLGSHDALHQIGRERNITFSNF